jgi:hypothetical protein
MTASEAERKEKEKNFKKVGEAFAALFNPVEIEYVMTANVLRKTWKAVTGTAHTEQVLLNRSFRFNSCFTFRFRQKH